MYKFVKIKLNHDEEEFQDWFFYPQTKEEVAEHWDKYAKPLLEKNSSFRYDDARDMLSSIVSGIDFTDTVGDIMNDLYTPKLVELKQRRVEMFTDNKNLFLAREGQSIEIPLDLLTITQTNMSSTLEYPE